MTLNARELELIEMLADPTDSRTKDEKSAAAGFAPKHIYALQKRQEFSAALYSRMRELTQGNLATIYAALLRKASEGDVKACEVYLKAMSEIQSGVNVTTNVTQTTNGEFREAIRQAQEERQRIRERAKRFTIENSN